MSMETKYNSLVEWRKAHPKDYMCAYNNGWIPKLCADMGWVVKNSVKRGHWTKVNCLNEARKYDTASEWKRASKGSYNAAQRNGWLTNIQW